MSGPESLNSEDISRILEKAAPSRRGTWLRRLALLLVVLILGVAALAYWRSDSGTTVIHYVSQPAERGDLHVTVTATGTLQPTNKVDVGSELSGIIKAVFVQENDRVEVGQELARLDTSKLSAAVVRADATFKSSEAKVQVARATVKEARANLKRLQGVRELSGGKLPAAADLDAAEATLERAVAEQASTEAAVAEARAALDSARTDLSKASLRSPINGLVLTRAVEPGQTVAASLQAPVLFTLAEDLAQMELHVDVDEADVGRVNDGQKATFNVDAYPDKQFPARITRVSYGAQTVDGVVTYETVMEVDNSDLSLRPGMTATADITVAERRDVLLVPNAALRFTPPRAETGGERRSVGVLSRLFPRPPRSLTERRQTPAAAGKQVWVLQAGAPEAVAVTTGASDGRSTEITGGALEAGMAVVVDAEGPAQ